MVAILGAVIGTFGVVVLASEYAIGGGVEWGGRFFFPALAPLAVAAMVVVGAVRGCVGRPTAS